MDPQKPTRLGLAAIWFLAFTAVALAGWEQIVRVPAVAAVILRLVLAALVGAGVVGLGLWLSGRTGLGFPALSRLGCPSGPGELPRSWLWPSVLVGVGGLGLLTMELAFLRGNPAWLAAWAKEGAWPAWRRLALCYEAGVLEEMLFRLIVLSFVAWALSSFRKAEQVRPPVFWAANVVTAVFFGLAHFSKPFPLSPAEMAGILLLNGAGALAFGWLFWKKGLEGAILAHFTADFVVRVIGHLVV